MGIAIFLMGSMYSAALPDVAFPHHVYSTNNGLIEIGSCDSRIETVIPDNPATQFSASRPYHTYLRKGWDRHNLSLGMPDFRHTTPTCRNNPFVHYAAGRFAVRNIGTGEVRVTSDRPRLTDCYSRIHQCSTASHVYYTTSYALPETYGIRIEKISHDLLTRLPVRGSNDANEIDTSNHNAILQTEISNHSFGFCVGSLEDAFDPGRLDRIINSENCDFSYTSINLNNPFDISCLSDEEVYVFILDKNSLVQYRDVLRARQGAASGAGNQSWNVVGTYKTDLVGSFWIVQVASTGFVAIDLRGRVLEFKCGLKEGSVHEIAKSGRDVRITHAGRTAAITSDKYNLRVTSTGVEVLINTPANGRDHSLFLLGQLKDEPVPRAAINK